MGTIKDIVDLVTQLSKNVQDRTVATELLNIISIANQIQSDMFELQKENLDLKKEISDLETKNQELNVQLNNKNQETIFHSNLLWKPDDEYPYCPTCYESENKLIHMQPWDAPYTETGGAIRTKPRLKCPKCNHNTEITKHPKMQTP
jgi:hypothetical protein